MASTSLIFNLIGRDGASPAFRTAGASALSASAKIDAAGKKMRTIGSTMNRSVTLPVVAAAAASVKLAADFQESMEKIHGLVGISRTQVAAWSDDILKLSTTLPESPKELADAMFFITSAGLRGKTALDALDQSARAAASGLGDTKTVADAVTSAMNAYGADTLTASHATDILTAAVREGKLAASSLAPVIGKTLPIAKAMGVSFAEVAGSMALMSKSGTNAAQASTQVTAVIGTFAKPSADMITALGKMHTNLDDVRKSLASKGMVPTLTMLRNEAKKAGVDLSAVFGNKRALTGVLQLTGNLKDTHAVMKGVADSAGSADKAFESAAETANFKFQTALSKLQVAGVKLGTVILPAVTSAVDKLVSGLEWFQSRSTLFKQITGGAVLFLAVLGPLLSIGGRLVTLYSGYIRVLEMLGVMQKQTAASTTAQTAAQTKATTATQAQATATQGLSQKMAAVRFGAAIAGMTALAASSQVSNEKLKALTQVGGAALLGFAAGGPIGGAIGAGAGLLGVMASNMKKAADAAKASRADYSALSGTLDSLTGATTSATRAFILDQLQRSGAAKNLAAYGITARTAVDALLGEAKARKVVSAAIDNQQSRYDSLIQQIKDLEAAQNEDAGMAGARARTQTVEQVARQKQIDSLKAQATAQKNAMDAVRDGLGVAKDDVRQKRLDIMATQDLAGKLKGIPQNVRSKIEAKGIFPTIKGIAEIAKRYHLMPKQIRTLISATGVDASVKQVEKARHHLEDLSKTKPNMANFNEAVRKSGAIADTDAKRAAIAIKGSLEKGPKESKADLSKFQASIRTSAENARGIASTGGHSVGDALSAGVIAGFAGTGDTLSRQAAAAVTQAIAAARRAADAHSPSRKMAQLGRDLMDGLVQGIADRKITVEKAMDEVQAIISKVGDRISNLMSTRTGFLKTFSADSIFGADLSTTTTDALGNSVTTPPGVADLIAFQKQQATKAHQLARDVKAVTKAGLSKALVKQLQSQGASGAAALHALATGSPAQIRQLNHLNKQTSESLRAAGLRAGNYARGGSIDADIRTARKQEHVLTLLEHRLKELEQTMKKDQTIIVKIGEEAIITHIKRRNHRKGVSTAGL